MVRMMRKIRDKILGTTQSVVRPINDIVDKILGTTQSVVRPVDDIVSDFYEKIHELERAIDYQTERVGQITAQVADLKEERSQRQHEVTRADHVRWRIHELIGEGSED